MALRPSEEDRGLEDSSLRLLWLWIWLLATWALVVRAEKSHSTLKGKIVKYLCFSERFTTLKFTVFEALCWKYLYPHQCGHGFLHGIPKKCLLAFSYRGLGCHLTTSCSSTHDSDTSLLAVYNSVCCAHDSGDRGCGGWEEKHSVDRLCISLLIWDLGVMKQFGGHTVSHSWYIRRPNGHSPFH